LSSNQLTPFSYVVLVLVGRDGAGPHDLVRMARQGRIYADYAESQWYAEPKRLERLGYLASRKEPGRTRPRTHYSLTDAALAAIRDWMKEPTGFSRIQLEPAWRLLAADLVGEEAVLSSLEGLHAEIDELRARLDAGVEIAASMPHRARYLLLNHALARRIVDAHADWLSEVERALGDTPPASDPPSSPR
jgi:DNA-binding PadR family transcriptional regulator